MKTCCECGVSFLDSACRNHCSIECLFWSRVDKSGGPDACWLWTGHKNPQNGYGSVDSHLGKGRRTTAHRHAFTLHYACDPGELHVLHKCDVRHCANPRHLFLGTPLCNWLDAVTKGRPMASSPRLTSDEVAAIRRSAGRVCDIARQHQVSASTISAVLRRVTWRHVD